MVTVTALFNLLTALELHTPLSDRYTKIAYSRQASSLNEAMRLH